MLHGQVRAVPVRTGAAYVQTSYHPDQDNQLVLDRVAVLSGDSVRVYLPGSPMLRAPGSSRAGTTTLSGQNDVSARALYAVMRDALRRGDWLAFGRAFDALGRVLAQRSK